MTKMGGSMMAECTKAERAWLDAMAMPHDSSERGAAIDSARAEMLQEKVPPEVYENLVLLRAAHFQARRADRAAWDALRLERDEVERLYDRVEADAEKSLVGT